MRKSLKRILAFLVIAAVLLGQGAIAFADAPYRSYVQTKWMVRLRRITLASQTRGKQ